ncbi:MAG: MBL fold metallo-hydrolase [Phycisphaerae bacterium]|nr:MBL fold metallo-hydrolase [Phycisphaerae bacterium]
MSAPRVTLLGSAGEVTGSCTLVEAGAARVVVDVGMIQGSPQDELRNRELAAIDWSTVNAVVVTHVHIDHCGRLPMLHAAGFTGTIWMTQATHAILPKVLRGSASLQQVRRQEWRAGTSPFARAIFDGDPLHHTPQEEPEPPVMFVNSHVTQIMNRAHWLRWNEPQEIAPGIRLRLLNAGHVLGAASAELTIGRGLESCVVLCSGDLGPRENALHEPPASPQRADLVVLESTNGARAKPPSVDPEEQFIKILAEAGPGKERILIPTFAVGRAQQIVLRLANLARRNELSGLNVYLDSTMAVRMTDKFREHLDYLAPAVKAAFEAGTNPLEFSSLQRLKSRAQSLELRDLRNGGIILAGAGFCDAGPILHHLAAGVDREDCRVILAGYHPTGSVGDGLRRGAKRLEINGAIVEVRARIHEIDGLSGHGDRGDLLGWLEGISERPAKVILNHGTDEARAGLAGQIHDAMGITCATPKAGEPIEV